MEILDKKIRIALIQQSRSSNVEKNLKDTLNAIDICGQKKVDLVVLEELFETLYFCQETNHKYFDYAKPLSSNTIELLSKSAKKNNVIIVGSVFEKNKPGIYFNTAIVIEKNGKICGIYRKMHIPDDPGFYEKYYFTQGDLGFNPIETSIGKIGVLVCWDQWFPEAARIMALKGAEILVYPTAIGWDPDDDIDEKKRQLDAWITIQRAHAIANGLFVVSVNRVGFEKDPSNQKKGIQFWGNSFCAGPQGEILAIADDKSNGILIVEIDKSRIEKVRRIWPYFRDRRIDSYSEILKKTIN